MDDNQSVYTKFPSLHMKFGTRLRYLKNWSFAFENYLGVYLIVVIRYS